MAHDDNGKGRLEIGVELERRRREVASRWDLGHEIVLIAAGEPVAIPGRGDRTYPFRAHSEYYYLTDRERPGGVLAFDPCEGWVDFVVPVTPDERLWEGAGDNGGGVDVSELASWLDERKARPVASLGTPIAHIASPEPLTSRLRGALNDVRRRKDEVELARMRAAQEATAAGFAAIKPLIVAGRTERAIQVELEVGFFRHGADFLAFDTIVASGPNSAVLHFAPSSRPLARGELVLIDAGAEFKGYAADVTRTYAVSNRFTAEQRELYSIVEAARRRGIECCAPGTEWREVHRAAARVIAEGLVGFGLLRGDPESLVEQGAQSVFFPHGVGHMVGLGVRDAGEVLPGRESGTDEFPRLRMDLPLAPRFVVTIEPGIYLVPALIHDPDFRDRFRGEVDWDRAEAMVGFGGIRIEDNVLVKDDGHEVLTRDVPYSVED